MDVTEENRIKTLYLFWTTELEGTVAVETMEALASVAQRYSVLYRVVCHARGKGEAGERGRRFFPEGLHGDVGGVEEEKKLRGRDLDSFRRRKASWMVEFNGALNGVGVRLFRIVQDGLVGEVVFTNGLGLTIDFKFGFKGDSSYQNAMELLAFTVELGQLSNWVGGAGGETNSSKNAMAPAMILVELYSLIDTVFSRVDMEFWDSRANTVCGSFSRGRNHQ